MPRKRFLDYLGEIIDKAKLRQMSQLMELSGEEQTLLLTRFSDDLNVDQVADLHSISHARQKRLVPILEDKVQNWIVSHFQFFNNREIKLLAKFMPAE